MQNSVSFECSIPSYKFRERERAKEGKGMWFDHEMMLSSLAEEWID